jgi:hypothetical protein
MTFQKEHSHVAQRSHIKSISFFSSASISFYSRSIFFGAFIFVSSMASGQRLKSESARNAVYTELASRGPVYSINYDRIFRQGNKLDYSFSGGFSIAKNAVSFPVGIHFITTGNEHHAEFSVTFIPYIDYKHHLIGSINKTESDKYLYINPAAGYRYQKNKTGLFLKALIGPSVFLDPPSDDFWNMDPKLYAFGSIGVGISF